MTIYQSMIRQKMSVKIEHKTEKITQASFDIDKYIYKCTCTCMNVSLLSLICYDCVLSLDKIYHGSVFTDISFI